MSNPWLSIALEDYEGHMSAPGVQQLALLAELSRCVLDAYHPESVAVLGVAGGNGLEQIDCATTKRIVGIDVNQRYLDETRRRWASRLPGLELYCQDLAERDVHIAPVALVHAALIFEHTGLGAALEYAVSLVAAGGHLSVVLQLPSGDESDVTLTKYTSMQTLKRHFQLIDRGELQGVLRQKRFEVVEQEERATSAGKTFWLGVFSRCGERGSGAGRESASGFEDRDFRGQ